MGWGKTELKIIVGGTAIIMGFLYFGLQLLGCAFNANSCWLFPFLTD